MQISKSDLETLGWTTHSLHNEIIYTDVTADSRQVTPGFIFFAFDGAQKLGKDFIPDVLEKGASAVFTDNKYKPELAESLDLENSHYPVYFSDEFVNQAGKLASVLLGNTSNGIDCIAVTGTNGKTTTAWAIYKILKELGQLPSYIGTIGIELPESSSVAALTTPPLIQVHKILHDAKKQSGKYAVFETSSHGLEQGRLAGVNWKLGLFTNLTEDHRDYHGNMESYFSSKKILFENLLSQGNDSTAIINVDDSYGKRLYDWMREQNTSFRAVSLGFSGEFKIVKINTAWNGYSAVLGFNKQTYELKSSLIGNFNIYNLSMAFAALFFLGFTPLEILSQIEKIKGAPGRMEVFRLKSGAIVVVDYAHTPDALKKALETLRELKPSKLSIVFGCGGDRDKAKRPQMGQIAENFADHVVITNDNPRSENSRDIIKEIENGMTKHMHAVIEDRRQAIEETSLKLTAGEVLLIAGKGHEDYQILPEGRIYFSDREIARALTETIPPVFDTVLKKGNS
jgi:UDP-N-acetylmuramoyl-L-alanyl-D-glutamate--2,6-diaminopimelate ligase